jgi:hypothetical protein
MAETNERNQNGFFFYFRFFRRSIRDLTVTRQRKPLLKRRASVMADAPDWHLGVSTT